jgi:hypothetical protein
MALELFDFDEWSGLAKSNPNEFEMRRIAYLERLILRVDSSRLRGLQWRIDNERKLSKSPLKFCLHLYTLMWDSFLDLKETSNDLVYKEAESVAVNTKSLSNVISLHKLPPS